MVEYVDTSRCERGDEGLIRVVESFLEDVRVEVEVDFFFNRFRRIVSFDTEESPLGDLNELDTIKERVESRSHSLVVALEGVKVGHDDNRDVISLNNRWSIASRAWMRVTAQYGIEFGDHLLGAELVQNN